MSNKNLGLIIISLIVGGLVGNYVGMNYYYNQGVSDSRIKLEKVGILQPLPKESLSVFGKVLSYNGQRISLEIIGSYDPLSDSEKSEIKTVLLQPATVVILRTFDEQVTSGAIPYTDTAVEQTKISAGDQIVVESVKNVIGAKKITAIKIIIIK